MDKIKDFFKKIISGWKKLDKKKKKILVFALVALTLFVCIYTFFINRVTYTVLFTNLEIEDAAKITADLDAKKNIKYKLENGGKDIYIDSRYVDKYRLELASAGLMPQNSTGFEIFDNTGMMVTDKDRDIMYQRALEGELQRSIMTLDEIQNARVHLVMSKDSVFETEKSQASASVIVSTKPGKKLNSDQVRGIAALVSGAVENLPEANVKIIDSSGNILYSGEDASDSKGTAGISDYSRQSEIKKGFEAELEKNIMAILGPAYGVDKIKVAVYADLDFDAQEQTVIKYENPVVRSEQKSASGSNVNSNQVSQNPVSDNTQNVLNGSGGSGLESFSGTVNYELNQSTTTTVRAPGKVNKITTSVIYDGNLSAEQKAGITNLISAATGYDANRGDLIDVEGIVFDKTYQNDTGNSQNVSFIGKYGKLIIIGVLGAVALLILIIVLRKVLPDKKSNEIPEFEKKVVKPSSSDMDIDLAKAEEEFKKKFESRPEPKEEQLKKYVQEHPEIAAELIKAWIKVEGD